MPNGTPEFISKFDQQAAAQLSAPPKAPSPLGRQSRKGLAVFLWSALITYYIGLAWFVVTVVDVLRTAYTFEREPVTVGDAYPPVPECESGPLWDCMTGAGQ